MFLSYNYIKIIIVIILLEISCILSPLFAQSEKTENIYSLRSTYLNTIYSGITVFQAFGNKTVFKVYNNITPNNAVDAFSCDKHSRIDPPAISIDTYYVINYYVIYGVNTTVIGTIIPVKKQSEKEQPPPPGARLGISMINSPGIAIKKILKIPKYISGVLVYRVYSPTPVSIYGLKENDFIIRFDDKIITRASDLKRAVHAGESNKNIPVVIYRNGIKTVLYVKF